ncbi:MAG: T9SS C-terminal target domain-containing protein [Chitinophagaceae bacterium]|nr:MAG: T9SS C-terminal target domain-containing protein [Chitinophagaceae bacterium]
MNDFKVYLSFLLMMLLFSPISDLRAQSIPFFESIYDVPVSNNGHILETPWIGGLNNPQFSEADLNNNGINDLVIFDRTGFKVLTFINNGIPDSISYTYAPEYAERFPSQLRHWMLMKDMACNGIPDIISSQLASIRVYRGFYEDDFLTFEVWDDLKYQTTGSSGIANIFVTQIDIPGFADINNDGDIDVLAFDVFGGYIHYYENLSSELGMCGDTLIFKKVDDCWGNIFESEFQEEVLLLDTCGTLIPTPQAAKSFRHPGSTLLPFDLYGNGLKDLILGDIVSTKLNRLVNAGTPDSAKIISQDINFPSYNVPVNIPYFAAAFAADVNNNGKKDLLVAPNSLQISENINCSWMYENVGEGDTAVFELRTTSFLVGEMIDVGEGSIPIFFDHNGNGIKDLVIANYGKFVDVGDVRSALTLYVNTGTNNNPAYELADEDFGNVSILSTNQLHPAFGDLTGNGVEDMIVGDRFGNLHFFENTAQAGDPANFVLSLSNLLNIGGSFAAPFLYDVNANGKLDLLVGERNGNVRYYENIGTAQNFFFDVNATNSFLGQMDAREPGVFTGHSIPWVSGLDSTDNEYILLGTNHGKIKVYQLDRDSLLSGSFPVITENFSNINLGSRSAPTVYEPEENRYFMISGNYRGGLTFYQSSDSLFIDPENFIPSIVDQTVSIKVFPNPAAESIVLQTEGLQKNIESVIQIFDMQGRKILNYEGYLQEAFVIPVKHLNPGIYVIQMQNGKKSGSARFLKVD